MTGNSAAKGKGNSTQATPIRVLLADDHRILRQGLVSLLQDEPDILVVAEARDGQEAVDLAHQHKPDVIVMDITMPRLSGIEATALITAQLPAIRIIGLSVHPAADMAEAMRQAGAAAYLTKDGPVEDLVAAIRGTQPDPAPTPRPAPLPRR